MSHENPKNDAIQLALNAAVKSKISSITVCVGSGIFPEQLNITSRGGISLMGRGTLANPTVIDPSSVVVNNYDTILNCCTFAQAAIILAGNNGTGATLKNINIRNLVIDGDGARSSINNYPLCYADFAGINFDGASGSITDNTIKNMYMPLAQDGCGDGGGIDVDINNNLSPAETVTLSNNFIPNYGEFGIGCWGPLQTCMISNNKVSFYSPYSPTTAPAGIAILGGAVTNVAYNSASGNICTNAICGPNLVTEFQASGILTSASAAGTILRDNTLADNDLGISVFADTTSVLNNKITDSTFVAVSTEDGVEPTRWPVIASPEARLEQRSLMPGSSFRTYSFHDQHSFKLFQPCPDKGRNNHLHSGRGNRQLSGACTRSLWEYDRHHKIMRLGKNNLVFQEPPLTQAELETFLRQAPIATLCIHNEDGKIHAAPIWF